VKTRKGVFPNIPLVLTIFIVVQILQIVYAQRSYFLHSYNKKYWQDRYEHSQYQLPLSNRIIGDDGLYSYAGYRMINGADPFSINVDKPPFGKYIIGFSIALFRNPAISSLLLGLGTIVLLYTLSKTLLLSTTQALIITALFSLDAMFFSQLWITGLDIIQLFWFLLSLKLIFYWYRSSEKRTVILMLSGITLGFFSEVKPPILLLVIIPLYLAWIIISLKKFVHVIIAFGMWGMGFFSGLLLPYLWYLHLDHSILDVAKVHKFMLAFYQSSTLPIHVGAILQALFIGTFPNVTSNLPVVVHEWWIIWVVISLLSVLAAIEIVRKGFKQDALYIGLIIILIFSTAIFSFIPSYPRYLLLLLPFFYIVSMRYAFHYLPRILLIPAIATVLLYGLVRTTVYLRPSPDSLMSVCLYSYAHQYFQDVYEECLDHESKAQMNPDLFRTLTQKSFKDAEIVDITAREIGRNIDMSKQLKSITVEFVYKTLHLGSFTEIKMIPFVNEEGQWKIKWQWNLLLEGFRPGYSLITRLQNGNRGSIVDSVGTILAKDAFGYLILVNPSLLDTKREEGLLKILGIVGSVSRFQLQNQYLENPLPGESIPLFSTFEPLAFDIEKRLRSYPGVTLIPYRSRLYTGTVGSGGIINTMYSECCTRIYSSFNYHGVSGPDYTYDSVLSGFDGGALLIVNENGETVRTIIQKIPKDGINVILPP
jgi:hypothetical protein